MRDANYNGIGDPMALSAHHDMEDLADKQYEGFEYELEERMNTHIGFKEGIALLENAFTEWSIFCEDEGYDPDKVGMLKEFSEGFLKMTGDTP